MQLNSNHHFEGFALVHGLIATGYVIKRDDLITHPTGFNLACKDIFQQLREASTSRCWAAAYRQVAEERRKGRDIDPTSPTLICVTSGPTDNVRKLGHQRYHVKINVPTPDYIVYGYVWEVLRLLHKEGEQFLVLPDAGFGNGITPGAFEVKWRPEGTL